MRPPWGGGLGGDDTAKLMSHQGGQGEAAKRIPASQHVTHHLQMRRFQSSLIFPTCPNLSLSSHHLPTPPPHAHTHEFFLNILFGKIYYSSTCRRQTIARERC